MISWVYFKIQRLLRRFRLDVYVLPLPKRTDLITVKGRCWSVGYAPVFKNDTNWLRIPMYADLLTEMEHLMTVGGHVVELGGSEGVLRRELQKTNPDYIVAHYPEVDAENLPYSDESIDVVVLDQVLEHLKHPWFAARQIWRVLKRRGICICTTVFVYPLHRGNDYGDYYRFSPDGLRAIFEGFEVICARGWGSAAVMKMVYDASERGPEGQPPMGLSALMESGLYDYSDSMNYLMTWCIVRKR